MIEKELAEIKQQLADIAKKVEEMETITSKPIEPEIPVGTVCRFWDDCRNGAMVGVLQGFTSGREFPYMAMGTTYAHAEPHPDYMNWVANTGERPSDLFVVIELNDGHRDVGPSNSYSWDVDGSEGDIKRYAIIHQ